MHDFLVVRKHLIKGWPLEDWHFLVAAGVGDQSMVNRFHGRRRMSHDDLHGCGSRGGSRESRVRRDGGSFGGEDRDLCLRFRVLVSLGSELRVREFHAARESHGVSRVFGFAADAGFSLRFAAEGVGHRPVFDVRLKLFAAQGADVGDVIAMRDAEEVEDGKSV